MVGGISLIWGIPIRKEAAVKRDYDLLIIGGGSAGLTAARFARQLDLSVALVEKGRLGGDCTWTGCVPSKTLLKAAKIARTRRVLTLSSCKVIVFPRSHNRYVMNACK